MESRRYGRVSSGWEAFQPVAIVFGIGMRPECVYLRRRRPTGMLSFLRCVAMLLLALPLFRPANAVATEPWLLQDGTEYFGSAESYDFETRELTIRKADGKPFSFPASELAFGAKLRLIDSPVFQEALRGYRPPLIPLLALFGALGLWLAIPILLGVWGGAHVLGTGATVAAHFMGFAKLLLVSVLAIGAWLGGSIFLDPNRPILPDKHVDGVLISTTAVLYLLVGGFWLASHYRVSFKRGMATVMLATLFAGIVGAALALGGLFTASRMDAEVLLTRAVFEPFKWF